MFSDYVPTTRKDFYRSFRNADGSQHFSEADIEAQYQRDVNDFRTFYTMSYYYAELLMLDAGSWFNNSSLEEARPAPQPQRFLPQRSDRLQRRSVRFGHPGPDCLCRG